MQWSKLRFDMRTADESGEKDHPQRVMQKYGISYADAEPISIADCWIFYECEAKYTNLPTFIKPI